MKACPKCGEEWPSTASACTCGASLDAAERANLGDRADRPDAVDGRRSGASTLQVVISVIVVLALVPSVVILARTLSSSDDAPSAVDVPDNAPEAQPDQLPDRRARPDITCSGPNVADDCLAFMFTLPGNAFVNYSFDVTDTAVAVRTRDDVWLLDATTGEQRWHRAVSAGPTDAMSVWLAAGMAVLQTPDGFRTFDATTGEPAATVTLDGVIVWTGADGQRVVTVTRDDDVIVQGWDPASGDLLWATQVDVPWTSAYVNVERLSPATVNVDQLSARLGVIVGRVPATENSPTVHTAVDTSDGQVVDSDGGVNLYDSPAWRTYLDGTRLWSAASADAPPDWERDLGELVYKFAFIHPDHVALGPVLGPSERLLIIDGRTGNDTGHVQIANGTIQERSIWRPWPGAQAVLMRVQTTDAAHLVLVNMPLD